MQISKKKSYGLFPITNGVLVTSVNYEKFVKLNGSGIHR